MKKIVLSLAGVLAATAFAPEAAAIPAYARQVGMACAACHQQHFPILNSFGRAFKAGGYTMMGAQGKVEGDHLSIPDTLNLSMIIKLRYLKDNTTNAAGVAAVNQNARAATMADGMWEFFDEFALLGGGRIAENVGFFFEGQMLQTGPLVGIIRMPFVWDMGGAKLSVIPFMADGGSAMVGCELSSGGVLRANRWAEDRSNTSAVQYVRNKNAEEATGIAFVAQNDMGFINVTPFTVGSNYKDAGGGGNLKSTYIRVAATPTVADWAMVVGAGKVSGQSWSSTNATSYKTDKTFFDFQAHGEVGGKEIGIYAQHAKAPNTSGAGNAYNNNAACVAGACNPDKKATTIGVDYSVIPHSLHIGAAYMDADTGAAATANGLKATTLTAVYDLYQNVALHAWYNRFSGSSIDAGNLTTPGSKATNAYSLMLEMAW